MFQGAPPASPANNTRDYHGNLHHDISKVAQKATLTPTIKRETVYTKECHTSIEKYAPPWTVRRELWTDSLWVEHSGISTDILLFSELGLSLTQHYRVYRGGLPHAVFRTDYMQRLRALLPSPRLTGGEPASPTDTGRGLTPKSARRLHHSSRPMRRMSEAVDDGPLLTVENPGKMIGETVIDCQPYHNTIVCIEPRNCGRGKGD